MLLTADGKPDKGSQPTNLQSRILIFGHLQHGLSLERIAYSQSYKINQKSIESYHFNRDFPYSLALFSIHQIMYHLYHRCYDSKIATITVEMTIFFATDLI